MFTAWDAVRAAEVLVGEGRRSTDALTAADIYAAADIAGVGMPDREGEDAVRWAVLVLGEADVSATITHGGTMPFPTEHNITARGIRHGDVFVLHGHVRTADGGAWPAHPGHVHIAFADGGDAILPADRPVTVTRMVEDAPCSV